MPFSQLMRLPAGSGISKAINLPLCGGWNGNVIVSMTAAADVTITNMKFHRDAGSGGLLPRTIGNLTVSADTRKHWPLEAYEGGWTFTYSCTSDVTIAIESKRGK
jgi:hypothetical protein